MGYQCSVAGASEEPEEAREPEEPRTEPPFTADERATLVGFLQWQRGTLELKCAGLDATELAERPIAPSALSLIGLIRHMADVERFWFRQVMAAGPAAPHYWSDEDPDADFNGARADEAEAAAAWETWRAEIAFADQFVADAPDLDMTGDEPWRGAMSLRWVLTHMIEEYARHNGHADLIREQIDGVVGE